MISRKNSLSRREWGAAVFASLGTVALSTLACGKQAESQPAPARQASARCAHCGMRVDPQNRFSSYARMQDGVERAFDAPKCLFRWSLRNEPASRFVRDYYTGERIEWSQAFFVLDSEVEGPMGHDLVSFRARQDGERFVRDHRGRLIAATDLSSSDIDNLH